MTVKQRIIEFIAYLNIGQSAFEKECGISNGSVNNIRVSIGEKNLQKIVLRYPELNPVWLKMGVGEMLNKSVQNKNSDMILNEQLPKYEKVDKDELIRELRERVKFQADLINELLSKIK